jgi:prepilin-type N-terminal cleavage/methylation domain-containing protein/prepilin-type processing-associated H-X9-DG protein
MSTRSAGRRWFRGFTLAELLVVIALIAVLSGFLLPILDGLREEGRRTVCLSHLQQIGEAHLLLSAILADYVLLTWGPGSFGGPDPVYFRWPGPPLSLGQVRRPAETFVLMDGWTTTGRTATHSTSHDGGSNVSFSDGHARWLLDTDLWRVDTNGRGSFWLHYGAADR